MEKMTLFVMVLLAVPLMAAAPPEVSIWTAADLKARGGKLAEKLNEQKAASERLASFGNHLTMIARRDGDGSAEIHDTQVDFFFVQSGTATLVYGGELPGAKATAPGEWRGPAIKGGERRRRAHPREGAPPAPRPRGQGVHLLRHQGRHALKILKTLDGGDFGSSLYKVQSRNRAPPTAFREVIR
jgi:hypothetical protein